jgi:outer membrane lipoprotein-sorting protein
MAPSRLHLVLALAVVTLAGCPRPLRFGPEGQITDPAYVLRRLDARAAAVRSVKAEARVSLKTTQRSGTANQFIAALKPASLHVETLNFFGKPVAALATDGASFGLFMDESATFYSGPASAANVGLLLPVAVEPTEAAKLLLGEVPRIEAEQVHLELDAEDRAYRLTLTRGAVQQRLWVATEDLRLLRSEVRGAAGLDVLFDDFQVIEGVLFPMAVEIRAVLADGAPQGTVVSLHYKDAEVNLALDPALFVLEQPPGTRRVLLDAAGRELSAP